MFGFLIGTACLIGLIATIRRGYGGGCGHSFAGHGCGGRGQRWGGHHAYRDSWQDEPEHHHHRGGGRGFRGGWGPRAWIGMLSQRLDLTPAQEKVVFQSFGEVRDALRKGRGELRDSRRDVAKAFRATSFDAVLMGETFSRHDNTIEEVRKAVVGALARTHEALDEHQREKLASILEEGWW